MRLSVIVPARNEADVLLPCLQSLVGAVGRGLSARLTIGNCCWWTTARPTVRDRSRLPWHPRSPSSTLHRSSMAGQAKRTRYGPRPGINRGEWILFTDADTVHEQGDLRRALHEAENARVAMLSYSPRQVVRGFWQRALMPLVFAELALSYPPAKVSDPASRSRSRQRPIPCSWSAPRTSRSAATRL